LIRAARGHRYVHSVFRESDREGPAQTAAASRNQRYIRIQSLHLQLIPPTIILCQRTSLEGHGIGEPPLNARLAGNAENVE
jgi:hypothetical protein